jgi:hypothetical protein
VQVEERGKLVCQPDGYYPSLTTEDVTVHFFPYLHLVHAPRPPNYHLEKQYCIVQNLNEKIDQKYRVRLILDNLPVTTYDLEENPESVRPGYEVGYEKDGKRYVNNHLMFKILVHQTNGQYTKARENMAEIEAAAIVEVSSTTS